MALTGRLTRREPPDKGGMKVNYALLHDLGREQHAELLRQAERADRLLRSKRVARLPAVLKGLLLLLS